MASGTPPLADPACCPAGNLLRAARAHDRAGHIGQAVACYEEAIRVALCSGERAVHAEARRRLGVLHHRRGDTDRARELCRESYAEAEALGDDTLAGEALDALAGFEFEAGRIAEARSNYERARDRAHGSDALLGRIEQNLGILANIQGEHGEAYRHYRESLTAFERAADDRGRAIAWHNLGMTAADRQELDEAERCLATSADLASRVGDVHLTGLCELNRAEVAHTRQQFGDAMRLAESALATFERLGARMDKAEAYKVIGMVFRDTGRPALAEERLRTAIGLALESDWPLGQAESFRELARLYQATGRHREALTLLYSAHGLFSRLDPRVDLVDIGRKRDQLEGTYLAVVRDWGQSIESADRYTFGHCERVAGYAVAVARALGLPPIEETTLRLGAYLHDVGKVRVPLEILNKPGRLSDAELEIMKRHPVYGVELLEGVEFPWDLKPIVRWHHERLDGTGYPDRLQGAGIPLGAQVIGIVDVFDALTTTRTYRGAMARKAALAELASCRHWWRADVYDAFVAAVGAGSGAGKRSAAA